MCFELARSAREAWHRQKVGDRTKVEEREREKGIMERESEALGRRENDKGEGNETERRASPSPKKMVDKGSYGRAFMWEDELLCVAQSLIYLFFFFLFFFF